MVFFFLFGHLLGWLVLLLLGLFCSFVWFGLVWFACFVLFCFVINI